MSKLQRILIFAGVTIVVLGAIPVLWMYAMSSVWTSGDIPHPSDTEMIANFQVHKAEFIQIVEMAQEDKDKFRTIGHLSGQDYLAHSGVPQTRIGEYQKVTRKLVLPGAVTVYENAAVIEFTVSTQGLAVGGSSKSYVYRKIPPENVVTDIDAYRNNPQINQGYPVYRHIEGNWYLCFEAN